MKKVSDSMKFKANSLRAIAFACAIPFGHLVLALFIDSGLKIDFYLYVKSIFSLIFVFVGNEIMAYTVNIIEKQERSCKGIKL